MSWCGTVSNQSASRGGRIETAAQRCRSTHQLRLLKSPKAAINKRTTKYLKVIIFDIRKRSLESSHNIIHFFINHYKSFCIS